MPLSAWDLAAAAMQLEEEAEDDPALVANCMFIALTALVILSVAFELTKDKITESASENTKPIVDTMWMELTVLGFLSLLSFLVVKAGILDGLSTELFGEAGELAEIVETVHMMLFLVMVVFMGEVMLLLRMGNATEKAWNKAEEISQRQDDHDECATALYLQRVHDAGSNVGGSFVPHAFKQTWPFSLLDPACDARVAFEYHLLRSQFVTPPEFSVTKSLIPDFKFSHYLSMRLGETLGEVVELPPIVWIILEGFFLAFWACSHVTADTMEYGFVGFGYLLLAAMGFMSQHVDNVFYQLLPKIPIDKSQLHHHISLRQSKLKKKAEQKAYLASLNSDGDTDEKKAKASKPAPVEHHSINNDSHEHHNHANEGTSLLEDWDMPVYLQKAHHGGHNPHYALFWGGHHGPHYLLHAVRVIHVLVAIYLSLLFLYFVELVYQPHLHGETHLADAIIYGILAVLPVALILLGFTPHFMKRLTIVTSVEAMRAQGTITRTLRHMRAAKALKIIGLIDMMKKWDRLRQIASSKDHTHMRNPVPLDPAQIKRFEDAFHLFDEDGSGTIENHEMVKLLGSLGVDEHSTGEIMGLLDSDGDGVLTLDEFVTNMGIYMADNDADVEDKIDSMFKLFDKDGSGEITTDEFRATLMQVNVGNMLSEKDIDELIHEIDKDDDREINLEEFKALIKQHLAEV